MSLNTQELAVYYPRTKASCVNLRTDYGDLKRISGAVTFLPFRLSLQEGRLHLPAPLSPSPTKTIHEGCRETLIWLEQALLEIVGFRSGPVLVLKEEELGYFWRTRVGKIKTQPGEASGLEYCSQRTWVPAPRENNCVYMC